MVIARNPLKNAPPNEAERQAQAFVEGKPATPRKEKREPVIIRFAPESLRRLDEACTRRGISRSSLVALLVDKSLERGDF